MGLMGSVRRNIKQNKGESRLVSYLIKIVQTGHRLRTLDIANLNTKSAALTNRPRFVQVVFW